MKSDIRKSNELLIWALLALFGAFFLAAMSSCEKDISQDNAASVDWVCVYRQNIDVPLSIHIGGGFPTEWTIYTDKECFKENSGKPDYADAIGKPYEAWTHNPPNAPVLYETGIIRTVVILDGISDN